MPEPRPKTTVLRNQPNTLFLGAQVRIDGVFDLAEAAYHGKRKPLDFKRLPTAHEDAVMVRINLRGRASNVRAQVEYREASKVHDDFYSAYLGLTGRAVAILHDGPLRPGMHELRWDGRDATADRRILLAGVYTLRVILQTLIGISEASTELEVAAPHGWNYALETRKTRTRKNADGTTRVVVDVESTVEEVRFAHKAQQKLSDGTSFKSELSTRRVPGPRCQRYAARRCPTSAHTLLRLGWSSRTSQTAARAAGSG